jgi:hypothetical protein
MATKLTKSSLKGLIKECLIELLSEGLSSSKESLTESIESSAVFNNRDNKINQTSLSKTKKQKKVLNSNFEKTANNTVKSITDDPIMAEMFADTAKGTLQEQLQAEGSQQLQSAKFGDTAAKAVNAVDDLGELFGDSAASNWANLAFESPTNKN